MGFDRQIDNMVNQAIKEIKERVMSVAQDIADEITEKVQLKFDDCIDIFYDDYIPTTYDRNYNTYMASTGTNKSFGKLTNVKETDKGVEIYGGIIVDSSLIGDGAYKDPTDYVFGRTWQHGIHGEASIWLTSPTPKSMMDTWFKEFRKNGYREIVDKYLMQIGLK